jgi:hypothetical protein
VRADGVSDGARAGWAFPPVPKLPCPVEHVALSKEASLAAAHGDCRTTPVVIRRPIYARRSTVLRGSRPFSENGHSNPLPRAGFQPDAHT